MVVQIGLVLCVFSLPIWVLPNFVVSDVRGKAAILAKTADTILYNDVTPALAD